MNIIGLIPARSGSKGVKRKNLRHLNGRPLISYAIKSALMSQYLTKTYITTDDEEVYSLAKEYGIPVIERPDHLASDTATMVEVIEHALKSVCDSPKDDDIFCLLQPTCPFRSAAEIDKSILKLISSDVDAVVGVTKVVHEHPERFYQIRNGYLQSLMPEYAGKNRQDLPVFYTRNGMIYTQKIVNFLNCKTFSPEKTIPLETVGSRSINIDQEEDFLAAEFFMSRSEEFKQIDLKGH